MSVSCRMGFMEVRMFGLECCAECGMPVDKGYLCRRCSTVFCEKCAAEHAGASAEKKDSDHVET